MNSGFRLLALVATLALSSCDPGNVKVSAGTGMYFGTSFFNPWFYGPGYRPPVVVSPPDRSPPPVPARPPEEEPAPR